MDFELPRLRVENMNALFVFVAAHGLDFLPGQEPAVARMKETRCGTATGFEQQLRITVLEVVEKVIGLQIETGSPLNDHTCRVERQIAHQTGTARDVQATPGLLTDTQATGRSVGERFLEFMLLRTGQVGLENKGCRRARNTALTAATEFAGPLLASSDQDLACLECSGGDEFHALPARGYHRACLEVFDIPGGQCGVLVIRSRRGYDGHQLLAVRTHGYRIDDRHARKIFDRYGFGDGMNGKQCQRHSQQPDHSFWLHDFLSILFIS